MHNYSFIIPHKNTPELLQRCLASIPERKDIQIIVVDDNSDGGKKPTINRKDVELILLDAEHAKGAGRARNVGLEHAEGKWVLFPDADDYYADDFIEILDTYIEKDFDILYFNYDFIEGNTGKTISPHKLQRVLGDFDGTKVAHDFVKYRNNVPWTKMVLNDYIKNYHFYFEEVLNGNDIFFALSIGYHTDRILVEKRPVYIHAWNENSISTSKKTVASALCRLEHVIKKNYFLEQVGHKKWKISVYKRFCRHTKYLGIPFLTASIRKSIHLYINRKDWWENILTFQSDSKASI